MYLSIYTKTKKVRDLLDISDPKDEMPTIQIQSLRPLRARVPLMNTEKLKWYGIKEKSKAWRPSILGAMMVIGSHSKTMKMKYSVSFPEVPFSKTSIWIRVSTGGLGELEESFCLIKRSVSSLARRTCDPFINI